MDYAYSSNGGRPHDWNSHQNQPQAVSQDMDATFTSEDDLAYPDHYGHLTPEFVGNTGLGVRNNLQRVPTIERQDTTEYRAQHTNSAPSQAFMGRGNPYPRLNHSAPSATFAQYSSSLQPSRSSNSQFLQPNPFPYERPDPTVQNLTPSGNLQSFDSWTSPATHSGNVNDFQSLNSPPYNFNPNSYPSDFAPNRIDQMLVTYPVGGGPQMNVNPYYGTMIENNQLDFIRSWIRSRPDGSIFDHIDTFSSMLGISSSDVLQLFDKLLKAGIQSGESAASGRSFNNVTTPLSSPAVSVSSPRQIYPIETDHHTQALAFLQRRGPQCEQTTDPRALRRKGEKIFQCTRCGRGFPRKHEWTRHEHANIYPQEAWLCDLQPCHNNLDFGKRIFFRRYQFMAHLKKCHGIVLPKEDARVRTSRMHVNTMFSSDCGFCSRGGLHSWSSRIKHIAEHFKDGKDMRCWNKPSGFVPESDSDSQSDSEDDDDEDEDDEDGHNDGDGDGAKIPDPGYEHKEGNNTSNHFSHASKGQSGAYEYGHSANYGSSNGTSNFVRYNSGHQLSSTQHKQGPPSQTLWNVQRREGDFSTVEVLSNVRYSLPRPGFHHFKDHSLPSYQANAFPIEIEDVGARFSELALTERCDGMGSETAQPHRSSSQLATAMKRLQKSFSRKSFSTKLQNLRNKSHVPDQMQSLSVEDIPSVLVNPTLSSEDISIFDEPIQPHYGLPESSYTSSSSLVSKQTGLEQRLLDEQKAWGNGHFIPNDAFERILTRSAVQRELDAMYINPSSALVDKIYKKACKVFGVLVCIGKGHSIREFIQADITDKDLPLTIPKRPNLRRPFQGFSLRELIDFARVQWSFLSPTFARDKDRINHYEFNDNFILPFIKDDEPDARSGGFGKVWSVVIHPHHQEFFQYEDNVRVAIKRLHSTDKADFDRERLMLKTLTHKKHDHLIQLLCTYKFKGQYHLMFPYAEANLREYWERENSPWSHETYLWVLVQLRGLASALNAIHAIHNNPLSSFDTLSQYQDAHLSVSGAKVFGRHGDIKPENILWFRKPGTRGILVITDLGLGNFHTQNSRSKVAARDLGGSVSYSPSELVLNNSVSRVFDIWSLGCVYLEFIIWLLQGKKALADFADERFCVGFDGVGEDGSFFQILPDSRTDKLQADVRPAVTQRFSILHKDPKCSKTVHDILNLIESQMLVIEPQGRIQSFDLEAKLEVICHCESKGKSSNALALPFWAQGRTLG